MTPDQHALTVKGKADAMGRNPLDELAAYAPHGVGRYNTAKLVPVDPEDTQNQTSAH